MRHVKNPENLNSVRSYNVVIGEFEKMAIVKNEVGDLFCIPDENHVLEIGEMVAFDGLSDVEGALKNMFGGE